MALHTCSKFDEKNIQDLLVPCTSIDFCSTIIVECSLQSTLAVSPASPKHLHLRRASLARSKAIVSESTEIVLNFGNNRVSLSDFGCALNFFDCLINEYKY